MGLPDTFHPIAVTTFKQVLLTSGRTVTVTPKGGEPREGVRVLWREPSAMSQALYGMKIDRRACGCRLLVEDAQGIDVKTKIQTNDKIYTVDQKPDFGDLGVTVDLVLKED